MKLYLIREKSNINATANYDVENKCFAVLKGSTVSESIAHSEKFRGAKSIEKARLGVLDGTKLIQDVLFKSSSTAANFVTGASTNGLTAWKTKDGRTLKEVLAETEVNDE